MTSRLETALDFFSKDFNCSQSVLYCFSDILNTDKDTLLKIATGFGAGTGRTQQTCGAVNGAVMVIGLLYGRGEHDEKDKQEDVYSKVQLFLKKFQEQFSTISCFEILDGCNLLTEQGQTRFYSDNLIEKCNSCIFATVKILEEIIQT
jgi:C_GCAxxG_C_C family probable redox protein